MAAVEEGQARHGPVRRAYQRIYHIQDLAATKLALVFGWTIWVFFVIPLIAPYFSVQVQAKVFYYASGWVQLFALPLMIYVSNKIQRTTDKQATDQAELLARNTELTEDSARLLDAITASRDSQERARDLVLENIQGVVTSNAALAAIIEHLTRELAAERARNGKHEQPERGQPADTAHDPPAAEHEPRGPGGPAKRRRPKGSDGG
jgi:hypothetical protein